MKPVEMAMERLTRASEMSVSLWLLEVRQKDWMTVLRTSIDLGAFDAPAEMPLLIVMLPMLEMVPPDKETGTLFAMMEVLR